MIGFTGKDHSETEPRSLQQGLENFAKLNNVRSAQVTNEGRTGTKLSWRFGGGPRNR